LPSAPDRRRGAPTGVAVAADADWAFPLCRGYYRRHAGRNLRRCASGEGRGGIAWQAGG